MTLTWGMVQRRAYQTVSPSGKSIVGSLISGEKDPTAIPAGGSRPPSGVTGNLGPNDSDCAGNNAFAFLWEPLCVAGKSTTKFFGEAGKWLPIIAIGGIGVLVVILVIMKKV